MQPVVVNVQQNQTLSFKKDEFEEESKSSVAAAPEKANKFVQKQKQMQPLRRKAPVVKPR